MLPKTRRSQNHRNYIIKKKNKKRCHFISVYIIRIDLYFRLSSEKLTERLQLL